MRRDWTVKLCELCFTSIGTTLLRLPCNVNWNISKIFTTWMKTLSDIFLVFGWKIHLCDSYDYLLYFYQVFYLLNWLKPFLLVSIKFREKKSREQRGVIFVRKVEKKEEYTRFGATRVEYFGFGPTGFTTLV